MSLIPLPRSIKPLEGVFVIDHNTEIVINAELDCNNLETAMLLQSEIKKIVAMTLAVKKTLRSSNHVDEDCICLQYDDTILKQEGYRISVSPLKIIIYACSNRGFLYGVATLVQLCKIDRSQIGCTLIEDEPIFENRGYMLDVTRGRVPTLNGLKELVNKLALYKMNQLQLNMESCFRFDDLEEIWSQTDPLTPEDILELDHYCAARGVELVPCIATFGHLYDLLRSKSFRKYNELDTPKDEPFTWYHRMRYHIINMSNPESFTLITDILDQYMPLFRSNKINICCDETFDLGKGRSATLAEKMSYGDMYYSYVNRLVDYVQSKGKSVMLWADIVLNHKEHMNKLHKEVTCLNWHYYYSAKEENVKFFANSGIKQYVCPSVSGYSRLVNAYDMSFANIKEMAEFGRKYNAIGFLNTDWGDSGHINMPALSIPGMIYGAGQSWNTDDNRDFATIDRDISLIEYGDWDKKLVGLLRELSNQDIIIFNDIAFFRDFKIYNLPYIDFDTSLYEKSRDKMMRATEEQLTKAVARCEEILNSLIQNAIVFNTNRHDEIFEFYLSARGVALIQKLVLIIKKYEYEQDINLLSTPYQLAGELEYWLADYCKAWRVASRESELYRIKEFVSHICSILRKYDTNESE